MSKVKVFARSQKYRDNWASIFRPKMCEECKEEKVDSRCRELLGSQFEFCTKCLASFMDYHENQNGPGLEGE